MSKHLNDNISSEYRVIEIGHSLTATSLFPPNSICTSKYSLLTFLPKNIFEQFHRIANVWFLIVSIFQILPLNLSPTSSWATIAPLSLVLAVTLLKDGYQDYHRHRSDREMNARPVKVWDFPSEKFIIKALKDLEVGNITLIDQEEPIAADILLLSSSSLEHTCYVETSNLDGESNLKIKHCIQEVASALEAYTPLDAMKRLNVLDSCVIKTEQPNNRMHSFEGSLKLKGHPRGIPLDLKNILLRGSKMKNTRWGIGVVIFTGCDTKLAQNSKTPAHKRSSVEIRVNRYLAIVFTVLFLIVSLSSTISIVYSYKNQKIIQQFSGSSVESSPLIFFTFMILYNSFVPISLYVTMDIVRVLQAKFIQWDLKMYAELTGTALVKNADLNEELGQIEYLFTDKTGTLTENVMEFKKCAIRGKVYGDSSSIDPCQVNTHEKCKFADPTLLYDLTGPRSEEITEFFEILGLCHTVIRDYSAETLKYQSASPDEEALVIAAHCFGVTLVTTKPNMYTLEINGESLEYKVLGINEFNSNRKCMSVVLEPMSDKFRSSMVLCKGADNMMLDKSNMSDQDLRVIQSQLFDFSSEGLRVLLVGKKNLTEEEAEDYERRYNLARNALSDRNKRLEELAEEFEKGLEIIGITAIEDKIQEKVPETIQGLRNAGIKIWMLTGDKQETAINIGYSSKLLTPDMTLTKINTKSIEEAQTLLKLELSKHIISTKPRHNSVLSKVKVVSASMSNFIKKQDISKSVSAPRYQIVKENLDITEGDIKIRNIDQINQCLVVDGVTLAFILADIVCSKYFVLLSALCRSIICCRVSPLQKSEVVKLVRNNIVFKPVTLAIGDGANDVSMIQEAHVGVGIFGKEGMQAANSSDYAIGLFKHLLPLLQVHGRWNYSRISRVILYSFYKNFIQVLPLFYYSFLNLYSGTAYYDSWLMLGYNVIFTALPVIVMGAIDRDLPVKTLLKNTNLYSPGVVSGLFNAKVFTFWILKAFLHSLIIFGLLPDRRDFTITSQGHPECSDVIGTASFFVVVQTATYEILLETEHWNWIFLLVTICSVLVFYPAIYIYDRAGFPTKNLQGVTQILFNSHYFVYVLLTPVVCLLVSLSVKYFFSLWTSKHAVDEIRRKTGIVAPGGKYLNTLKPKIEANTNRIKNYANAINKIFVTKGLKVGNNQDEDKNYYSIHKFFWKFQHPHLEKIYKSYIFEMNVKFIKPMFWAILAIYLAWSTYEYMTDKLPAVIVLRTIGAICIITVVSITCTRFFKKHYEVCLSITVVTCMILKTMEEIIEKDDGSLSSALVINITFMLFNICTYKMVIINILFLVTYLTRVSSIYAQSSQIVSSIIILNYTILLLGILFISAYIGFVLEKSRRDEFALKKKLEFQLQKGQAILGYLLPDFVKNRVKQGVTYIEEKEEVTIIFCDIFNFDLICATHESNELLELLDKFFAVLDQLCEKHGVTKIETVNKTYMICGGLLSDSEEANLPLEIRKLNHAERCVEVALQILKKIEPVYLKTGKKLQVKIGINSGKVIAGVVGEHKPQFSLVGNTVNTSARMCTTLTAPDKIQISSSTYKLIHHEKYSFVVNTVAPKGLDIQETYIVDLAKFRRQRKRDMRVNEEDSMVFESTFNQSSDQFIGEIKPSMTMLLPQIDESHISHSVVNFNLDDLDIMESEGLELVGPVQWLICSFKETKLQQKFRVSQVKGRFGVTLSGLWISIAIYLLELLMFILGFLFISDYGTLFLIILRVLYIVPMVILTLTFKDKHIQPGFPWLATLLYITTSFISSITLLTVHSNFFYISTLQVMYTHLVLSHLCKLTVSYTIIATISDLAIWFCIVFKSLPLNFAIESSIYISIFIISNTTTKFIMEAHARKSFNLKKFAKKEIKNTEKLLNQMMPPQVLRNLHNDITTTDKHKDVTIIYADISGFTNLCKSIEPIEVVSMLSKLFSIFDHLCVRHNVYKVHTIGDCYVILSFTDGDNRDPQGECVNCVEMALDMISAIKKVNKSKGLSLAMRIGIHTGTVIAGITGTNIVRYDIYGPDNDIANKMESQGMPGKVNISQVTKDLLQEQCRDRFDYVFNKTVHYQPTDTYLDSFFVVPVQENDILSDPE